MPLTDVEQIGIVVAGVVLTLLLGVVVFFWIGQEWRKLKTHSRSGSNAPDDGDADDQLRPPPADPSSGT
jgi:hypothetical protein